MSSQETSPISSVNPKWLTYDDAARYCSISKRTLLRYLQDPQCVIKPIAIFGRNPRISRDQLENAINSFPHHRPALRRSRVVNPASSMANAGNDKIVAVSERAQKESLS
jgi:hypothetical protein